MTRSQGQAERRARTESVALRLFRSRGYDNVTVACVCAAAGVSPATFYRHFGTKEEVVFAYQHEFVDALETAIGKAAGVAETGRLPAILIGFAEFLESKAALLAMRDEIVLSHPGLMRRTLAVQREFEARLARGLARLRGSGSPDSTSLLEAGVGMAVLRAAMRAWRADGDSTLVIATTLRLAELRALAGSLPDPKSSYPPGRARVGRRLQP